MASFFSDLQNADAANNTCFECGKPIVQWASVSHGIFLCLICSGTHRSFGVHVSFVKSINMDQWSEEQKRKMANGGNTRAKVFFKQEGIDQMDANERYFTKAAKWYRQTLAARSSRLPDPPMPYPVGLGAVIDENDRPVKTAPKDNTQNRANSGSFFGMLGQTTDGLFSNLQNTLGQMAEKATTAVQTGTLFDDMVGGMKTAGDYVVETAQSTAASMQDPQFMQQSLQKGATLGMSVINTIGETATDVMEKGTNADVIQKMERSLTGTVPQANTGAPGQPQAPPNPRVD